MAKFVYVYHGGSTPQSEAEGKAVMDAWMAWFGALGAAVVDGGAPLGKSKTVSANGVADNGGANPASGYSIVEAADMAAAVTMAKGCPILADANGSVEIAEAMAM
ncbi:MAG: hypothetical protein IPL47_17285 [Phyllobacteriaceae bacterium]|nr:hypothetical protein [Phyllobacteriaceae bacterium]